MKSIVAFVLACWVLGGSVLPGFSLDQSAHWGDLVEHYQQHRKTDPSLRFLDFMSLHYGVNSEHQKHPYHSHRHLPSSGHSMSVYVPTALCLVTPDLIQVAMLAQTGFFRNADLYSFTAVHTLINPPRW